VVDDQATVRRFTARVLCDEGCRVSTAADGEEMLAVVRQGASPVDVVVTDVVMPRINGVELLRQLAASHLLA
jgi:CheY-like chemotaxis protein